MEYVHPHIKATFNQRELGSDFDNFANGLRAALRQAPKVILVGEMRDRETVKIALSAAETGHLVLSTLHTINAGETINRILGMFEPEEQEQIRIRLADTLRWVVSQRLAPKVGGGTSCAARNHGPNLRTAGNHPPRRKRRQNLLRNHRGQLSPSAGARLTTPASKPTNKASSPRKPPCFIAPSAVSSLARIDNVKKARGENTSNLDTLRMKGHVRTGIAPAGTLKLK